MMKYFFGILLVGLIVLPVQAHWNGNPHFHECFCQGTFMGTRAVVQGRRYDSQYEHGELYFNGLLETDSWTGQMMYRGYFYPLEGTLQTPQGIILIQVIDQTGDAGEEMIIYHNVPRLVTPTLGELICHWR